MASINEEFASFIKLSNYSRKQIINLMHREPHKFNDEVYNSLIRSFDISYLEALRKELYSPRKVYLQMLRLNETNPKSLDNILDALETSVFCDSHFAALPTDVIFEIISHMNIFDICNLRLVSQDILLRIFSSKGQVRFFSNRFPEVFITCEINNQIQHNYF